ncbi:MAG: potassium transporter TrkA [Gaiellales bacterium]|nr:potassium transporter TrkA [Gaiellales bacterium]
MKTLAAELAYFFRGRARRNLRFLLLYVAFVTGLILGFAFLFRHLMLTLEGRDYSLTSSIYWTITAMSTLGFGDITFHSDGGRLFSMIVTMSGVLFLLILLPFWLISMFFGPYLEERLRYRPPLQIPEDTRGHVVICGWDPVTRTVAANLRAAGHGYVLIESDYNSVVRLEEEGVSVIYGIPTDAEVLVRARVAQASFLIANMSDTDNANLVLTVRSVCPTAIVAVTTEPERTDLMKVAGADQVVALREILAGYLAVRATTRGAMSHVVDSLGELLFAEIPAHGTRFSGQLLSETGIRESTGASVIGIWQRGRFSLPQAKTLITDDMVLMLAGTKKHLETLERLVGETSESDLIIILGYGTVGRAAAGFLGRNSVDHVVVDRDFRQIRPLGAQGEQPVTSENMPDLHVGTPVQVVQGDASRQAVLQQAGIDRAHGLIITTNDDGTNVFLTLACRQLNPHIRIVARANREENVSELYAAGADFVVSHSSVGASIVTNVIEGRKTIFLTEGVHIFWRIVPRALEGATLSWSNIRVLTGATVIAVQDGDGRPNLSVGPDTVLRKGMTLLMVGSPASETAFSARSRD